MTYVPGPSLVVPDPAIEGGKQLKRERRTLSYEMPSYTLITKDKRLQESINTCVQTENLEHRVALTQRNCSSTASCTYWKNEQRSFLKFLYVNSSIQSIKRLFVCEHCHAPRFRELSNPRFTAFSRSLSRFFPLLHCPPVLRLLGSYENSSAQWSSWSRPWTCSSGRCASKLSCCQYVTATLA
jgi:hypothetical protein